MELKEIRDQLLAAATLIGDYEAYGMSIDRDAALDKIRTAYQALRFVGGQSVGTAEPLSVPVATTPPEPTDVVEEAEEDTDDEPEVEVEFYIPDDEETEDEETESEQPVEPQTEPEVETVEPEPEAEPEQPVEPQEPVVEPQAEVTVEQVVEPAEPVVEPQTTAVAGVMEQSLFGDVVPVRQRSHSRRRLVALYDDDQIVVPQPKEVPKIPQPTIERPKVEVPKLDTPKIEVPKVEIPKVEAPKVEQPKIEQPKVESPKVEAPKVDVAPSVTIIGESNPTKVLGETVESVTTIADTIIAAPSVGESTAVDSLRAAITVGNRFMLVRDLFGGDEALYERTITLLDQMESLDDSIIYIAENFVWRPSSEGAKLIVDLLQRKFR